MVMLARIQDLRNNTIVVGSTHKWRGDEAEIKAYIGDSQAVIAGDQDWSFCDRVGLVHVDNEDHATWPALCETPGTARGDIIYSNMKVTQAEATALPCVTEFGNKIQLSGSRNYDSLSPSFGGRIRELKICHHQFSSTYPGGTIYS